MQLTNIVLISNIISNNLRLSVARSKNVPPAMQEKLPRLVLFKPPERAGWQLAGEEARVTTRIVRRDIPLQAFRTARVWRA